MLLNECFRIYSGANPGGRRVRLVPRTGARDAHRQASRLGAEARCRATEAAIPQQTEARVFAQGISEWAVRPLSVSQDDNGQATLLFEAPGGEPLDRLVVGPMEMGQFLAFLWGLPLLSWGCTRVV